MIWNKGMIARKVWRFIWPPAAYRHNLRELMEFESNTPRPIPTRWARLIQEQALKPTVTAKL